MKILVCDICKEEAIPISWVTGRETVDFDLCIRHMKELAESALRRATTEGRKELAELFQKSKLKESKNVV